MGRTYSDRQVTPREPDTAEVLDTAAAAPAAGNDVTVRGTQVGVGCHLANALIAGCVVRAYADVPAGEASAASLRMIGTGRVTTDGTAGSASVDIELNALGRRLLRRHPEGLRAHLLVDARPVAPRPRCRPAWARCSCRSGAR